MCRITCCLLCARCNVFRCPYHRQRVYQAPPSIGGCWAGHLAHPAQVQQEPTQACAGERGEVELSTRRAVKTNSVCCLRSPVREVVATRRGLGTVRLLLQRRGASGMDSQDPPIGRGITADAGLHEQPLAGTGGRHSAPIEDADGGRSRLIPS
jgi:hypothetical protein